MVIIIKSFSTVMVAYYVVIELSRSRMLVVPRVSAASLLNGIPISDPNPDYQGRIVSRRQAVIALYSRSAIELMWIICAAVLGDRLQSMKFFQIYYADFAFA